MRKIYASSYIFWVTSRITLIVLGAIDIWKIFLSHRTFTKIDLLSLLFLIGMSIVFFGEITKSKPRMFLKYCTGIATISIGLYIAYLKFSEPKASWGLARYQFDYMKIVVGLLSSWFILLGLFDFFKFDFDSASHNS